MSEGCGQILHSFFVIEWKRRKGTDVEKVTGYVEHIVFRNEENGYTVFHLENEDGEVTTDVYQLIFIGDDTTDSAYDTRFTLQLQEEDALLYLMDKKRFDRIIEQSFGDEAFTPVEEWYDGVTSDDNIYYSDGKAYGVKILSGNTFKENGLTDGDLYLAVRKNYRSPEKTQKLYDNCKKIAYIISK